MISAPDFSTGTKDLGYLDFNRHLLAHPPYPATFNIRNFLGDCSNIMQHRHATEEGNGTSVDAFSFLSGPRSHLTIHVDRVSAVDRHDTNAWTQERKVHATELDSVIAFSPLSSNATIPEDHSSLNSSRNSFALMELLPQMFRTAEHTPGAAAALCQNTDPCPHDWTPLVARGLGVPLVRPNVTVGPRTLDELYEGRRRIGEILVRCGVINVSGMPSIESATASCGDVSAACPVETSVIPGVNVERQPGENDVPLVTALAHWTSEWVHKLVIQPYLQRGFRFQYHTKPTGASAAVALRICRLLNDIYNPVQVAIHALWFIGLLTGHDAHGNEPFLSIPIFRYLHNNGTFAAEDFMFRTFVACAMIGDKSVNDATFSTKTWNRLTRIPRVILNATETCALNVLKWNVVMTQTQWQDTIIYLRSCIKMGSVFDPFAYDESSTSGVMARLLDELISMSCADESHAPQQGTHATEILAPQPIRHFTHWQVIDAAEWCPEVDPIVNQKPRTVGIAPGAGQNSSSLKDGTTAKDLLDLILGSSADPGFAHLARPAGTSFYGSFGAIGTRLANTVKMAGACQSASWLHSHIQ